MDVLNHRYGAGSANAIEEKWRDRWEREGAYPAPNPVGALAEPSGGAGEP
jgi:leucyl-tRNA synthetase